jgi:biopolymer transport protein ExbB
LNVGEKCFTGILILLLIAVAASGQTGDPMHKILARLMVCAALVGFGGVSASTYAQAPATPAADAAKPADAAATPAATPTPTPAAAPAAAKKKSSAEENPFGFMAMLEHGGVVVYTTLLIMAVMSIGSWYIMFTKLYEGAKISKQAKEAEANFWAAGTVRAGADALKADSPFRFIAEKGLEATQKHTGLLGQIDLSNWITMGISRAIDNVQSRLGDGLAFLATVGSTAPFVGLFGTVWGIYTALVKIGISGDASIAKVAGPVGEALIMTAIGLAVAVPAVLGYNFIVRKNKTSMDQIRAFGSDVHSVLLASANVKK